MATKLPNLSNTPWRTMGSLPRSTAHHTCAAPAAPCLLLLRAQQQNTEAHPCCPLWLHPRVPPHAGGAARAAAAPPAPTVCSKVAAQWWHACRLRAARRALGQLGEAGGAKQVRKEGRGRWAVLGCSTRYGQSQHDRTAQQGMAGTCSSILWPRHSGSTAWQAPIPLTFTNASCIARPRPMSISFAATISSK